MTSVEYTTNSKTGILDKILRLKKDMCYGIRLSHIFEISSISIENLWISIETLGISIQNFEILGFSHFEFEMLGIWNFDEIAGTEKLMSLGYFYSL